MKPRMVRRQPPYVAFGTFMGALDYLELAVLNGPLGRESCGVSDDATWYHLRRSLQLLDLIDDKDTPTSHLRLLLNDRKRMLKKLLSKRYPELFATDLSGFTLSRFNSILRSYGAKGGTLQRARCFFLNAARASGVKLSPQLSNAVRTRRRNKPRIRPNDLITNAQSARMAMTTQQAEVLAGHSNFTLTFSFDLKAMSESDHELLERLTHQLVSLQLRMQRAGRPSSDAIDNIKTFPRRLR